MSLDIAIEAAAHIQELRRSLQDKQEMLSQLNERRRTLVSEIDAIQASINEKRLALKTAAGNL